MNLSHIFKVTAYIAVARLTAIIFSALVALYFTDEVYPGYFYYPADTVAIIALLICGYLAAIGIATACLIWNVWHIDLTANQHIYLVLLILLHCLIAYSLYVNLVRPRPNLDWERPSVIQIFSFVAIYAVVKASLYGLPHPLLNGYQLHTRSDIVWMFLYTLAAAWGGFVVLSLFYSAYLSYVMRSNGD